jgi:hypothetical protein
MTDADFGFGEVEPTSVFRRVVRARSVIAAASTTLARRTPSCPPAILILGFWLRWPWLWDRSGEGLKQVVP